MRSSVHVRFKMKSSDNYMIWFSNNIMNCYRYKHDAKISIISGQTEFSFF